MSFTVYNTVLPDPDFGNTENLVVRMHVHRTMTGGIFTYVHKPVGDGPTGPIKHFNYTFSNVTYAKFEELVADLETLIQASGGFLITDHNGDQWVVYLTSIKISATFGNRKLSVVDFTNQGCGAFTQAADADLGTMSLEFEGYFYA